MKKRLLSALLALCMMFSLFPVSAFASADLTRGGVDNADRPAPQADLSEENGEDSTDKVKRIYVESDDDFTSAIQQIEDGKQYEIILRADIVYNGWLNLSNKQNVNLAIYSDTSDDYSGNYTITCKEVHGYGYGGENLISSSWGDSSLTIGKEGTLSSGVTIKTEADFHDGSLIYASGGNVTLFYSTLDGGGNHGTVGITFGTGTLTMQDSTIENCESGGIRASYGTVVMAGNSKIVDCCASGAYKGGGVRLDEAATLTMESGSVITGCSASSWYAGGVQVESGSTLKMERGSKIYNNTTTASQGGSDIYIEYSKYSSNSTATLVDATDMGVMDASGHAIDGWYPDDTNKGRTRYDATKHVDPVDVSSGTLTADSTTGGIGLVASHAVYDIAFDYSNTDNETDTCHAYSDAKCTKEITVAAPGDKVYLKYDENGSLRSGLAEGQCIGWEGVTGDSATEGSTKVRVIGADPDAYFTMPKEPAGNKVTLTPTAMNTADVDDGSEPEVPGSDGGSSDGGAGAVVAGVLIGGTAYLLTTRVWLEGLYGYLPANRIELALGLWKRADCPAPASTELYPDIDEDDTDAQAAARWCVEQGLLKDYHQQNEDGTETVTFKPLRYVARPYALNRWYKLEKLLREQQSAAQTAAEAPAEATETPAETDASAEA